MTPNPQDDRPVALIVEDRTSALEKRLRLFDAWGFCAIGAQSFGEAVDQLRSSRIDIVVTDINLLEADTEDRSGIELAAFVKQRRPGLPIIGYSGLFPDGDLNSDELANFDAFLPKGASSVHELHARLEDWRALALDRRSSELKPGGGEKHKSKGFDVFLSHNSKDKVAVRRLAKALKARGLNVWLDEWELVPGQPWHEALERIIETAKVAVVAVGRDGIGPWEDREMRGCLSEFVGRGISVIPVLLPGARGQPELPLFLKQFTWVDLRQGLRKEGLDRLEWGITGKKPVSQRG